MQSTAGNDETTLNIPVTHVNHAPKWSLSPIQLNFNRSEKVDYDLSRWATDSDGDKLTFSLVSSQAGDWATLTATGHLTGTVPDAQTNTSTFTVRVEDGNGGQADCIVSVNYVHANQPPHWTANPIKLSGATVGAVMQGTLSDYARDADPGAVLHYRKLMGPKWLTIDDNGALGGTPGPSDLGLNEFQVEVRDSDDLADTTQLDLQVASSTVGPTWNKNPVPLGNAILNKAYNLDLNQYIDGNPQNIKFKKLRGPDWLFLSESGQLSGTPVPPSGDFTAKFEASNGVD